MAKIKKPAGHNYNPFRHKPRGIHPRNFEKVYWPYLPLLLVGFIGAAIALQPAALSRIKPGGHVLGYSLDLSQNSLLDDTNNLRISDNLADLSLNPGLEKAAQAKAEDMAKRNYWSHNTPDGKSPWTFVTAQHYQYQRLGENLAAGFIDAQSIIKAWYASSSHRQNLLNPDFTDVGFGYANTSNYTAAGGGPMTIVVAIYGEPPGQPAAGFPNQSSGPSPATTESIPGSLASRTSRIQLALAKSRLAPVAISVAIVALLAAVGFWAGRHFLALRRAWVRSERFVIRHPALDLLLLGVAVLSVLLSQTAGYIQ